MTKPNKRTVRAAIITLLTITAAYLCRILGRADTDVLTALGITRSLIYICFFAAWGISVGERIINRQVRRFLICVSALMVFWLAVRTLKYNIAGINDVTRYLWYLFYVGMLFIPLLSLPIAISLGKPEDYRLPKWVYLLFIPAIALLLLVLTNDLHQLVFVFPADAIMWSDKSYGYGIGYWVVIACEVLCAAAAMAIMLSKCHVPSSRAMLWLPIIPFALLLAYGIAYILRVPIVFAVAGDITVVFCLFFTAVFESCIQCGLIQSNTGYAELFRITGIRAKITDDDYNILLSSTNSPPLPKDTMRKTQTAPLLLDGGIRLSGAAIRGGYVLWSDDVSELLGVLSELTDAKSGLEDGNALLRAEYTLKAREAHIAEQDRLYNAIQKQTARQIALLSGLTDEFERAETEEQRLRLLGKMTVIGAYLKRRNNLIFISDKSTNLVVKELELAFAESLDNLELYGVACGFNSTLAGSLGSGQITAMYDFFEDIAERSLDCMSTILIFASGTREEARITVTTDSSAALGEICGENISAVRDEDGEWQLTLRVKGGAV